MSDEEVIQKMMDHIISGLGSNFGIEQVYGFRIDKHSRIKKLKKEKLEKFLDDNIGVWCAIAIVRKIPKDQTSLDPYLRDSLVTQTINMEKGDYKVEPPDFKREPCTHCSGTGIQRVGVAHKPAVCLHCLGEGYYIKHRRDVCPDCKGKGEKNFQGLIVKCKHENCNGRGYIEKW